MRAYVVGSQISEHMAWSPEGYLILTSCVLCRTGEQQYAEREINNSGSNERVTVHRSAAAVLSDRHIGSLEGKPVTQSHPPCFLSPANVAAFQKGHVQNVRVGKLASGESCLIGDLIITDKQLADEVVRGRLREISTGYECEYRARDDGDLDQMNFLANHVAIVQQARANVGRPAMVKIMDGGIMDLKKDLSISDALRMLDEITQSLQQRKATSETTDHATDLHALVNDSPEAVQFADAMNAYGRRLRASGDCRPELRIRTLEKRAEVLDAKSMTGEEDAASYADSLRQYHRR